MTKPSLRYLQLLSEKYPTIQAASTAIINFSALLRLPKGTEHFLSDVHGEHEAFNHVIRNGAGAIWRQIGETFGNTLSKSEQRNLATLIYYPELKIPQMLSAVEDKDEWCRLKLVRLVRFCRRLTAKYRRSTVRGFLPRDLAEPIEELLYDQEGVEFKLAYYQSQIDTIVSTGSATVFITTLAELIRRLAVERLHVIGDIYDRGPGAHVIMDLLMEHHDVDIQWGNHDILWMGAAAGSEACMANVIRTSLRYGNLETMENGYGISLIPLASFALETYADDPCGPFIPRLSPEDERTEREIRLMAQMQKAIAIIQFKLESQIIKRRPHYDMNDRLLLDKIDFARGVVDIDGVTHPLLDTFFPTINPQCPDALTDEEQRVVEKLKLSFVNSRKLQQHARFLFSNGSIYLAHDGNLLYHGCIALNDDGSFRSFNVDGQSFGGRAFLDRVDRLARQGYFAGNPVTRLYGMDTMWFLWCAPMSPLFGKEKMSTFERYFLADKATHKETRNPYYTLRDTEETISKILAEFGLDPDKGCIINGHVPVKVTKGESPIKANGKLIVIDGGFSRAYQKETGIAGYTLISNSRGLLLAAHQPFESTRKAVSEELDIDSETEIIHTHAHRLRVADTDRGKEIQQQIDDLNALLRAFREGSIKEHNVS
ncbi:MAG: fructose-1,6-bisphosphatase [Candidatus Accumulibacter sp.]|jgi:fructose-1,6-bisphosphatase-3|nr:fructose-1,6-bisphosphatase [Accumulibacter sp.]